MNNMIMAEFLNFISCFARDTVDEGGLVTRCFHFIDSQFEIESGSLTPYLKSIMSNTDTVSRQSYD